MCFAGSLCLLAAALFAPGEGGLGGQSHLAAASAAGAAVPFVENRGQWPGEVRLAALVGGGEGRLILRAERGGLAVQVERPAAGRGALLRLEFEGGEAWEPVGQGERPERHHLLRGKDPGGWLRDVRVFERVVYADAQGVPRAEVRLAEGRLSLRGAGGAALPVLRAAGGEALEELWPAARALGSRAPGSAAAHEISVDLDFGLVWSTYLGGALGWLEELADAGYHAGPPARVVVCGRSNAPDFPITPGAFTLVTAQNSGRDVVAASFDAASGALIWSTVIGGSVEDAGVAVDTDALGNVYVGGHSASKDFPTTPGAYQESFDQWLRPIVLKLSTDGSELLYSTFIGGAAATAGSLAYAMRVRPDGAAVLVGETGFSAFHVTQGAYQTIHGGSSDAFVTVLSPDGSKLEWSTFLGADKGDFAQTVALGPDGSVTVAGVAGSAHFPTTPGAFVWNKPPTTGSGGSAVFVTRLAPDGSDLLWSAMIGWPQGPSIGPNPRLALGPTGEVALVGTAPPNAIPTTPGALQPAHSGDGQDGFALVLSADGSQLLAGTYLGGAITSQSLRATPHLDASGVLTIAGSTGMPFDWVTEPVLKPSGIGAGVYLARISPGLSRLLFGQMFGGELGITGSSARGLALLPRGQAAVAGITTTLDFPTTPGAFQPTGPGGQSDGMVFRHRMLPAGVHPIGRSGPACAGEGYLGASGPAQAGNAAFALYATGLPPASPGWLALGHLAEPALPLAGGPMLHVDPAGPLVLLPWNSGASGYAALDLPLPPAAAGQTLAAQLFVLAPTACAPAALAWTHALSIAIGP